MYVYVVHGVHRNAIELLFCMYSILVIHKRIQVVPELLRNRKAPSDKHPDAGSEKYPANTSERSEGNIAEGPHTEKEGCAGNSKENTRHEERDDVGSGDGEHVDRPSCDVRSPSSILLPA
jgi:hypothetical protein